MRPLTLGSKTFNWGSRTYLMGIINVTPDSFSGDGVLQHQNWVDRAVQHALDQVKAGADILDIGGESTRPGSQPVTLEEELQRVIPAIKAIAQQVSIPISIDTYKAEVARQAIQAGALLVNDVWGLQRDPEMATVISQTEAAVILVHNCSQALKTQQQSQLGGRYIGIDYIDLIQEIRAGLAKCINQALAAGIAPDRIMIDPGIGFGKTVEQNLHLINHLDKFQDLRYPLLVGPSRKSFVGYTLNLPPEERLEGTAAAVALCIDRGADLVRVHDVAAMTRVSRIADAISRSF